MKVGVDIGGSLTKIVELFDKSRKFRIVESTDAGKIAALLPPDLPVYATGCGASALALRLKNPVFVADELDSFCAGARQLVGEAHPGLDEFVLVSMGTGTSMFRVSPQQSARVAGTGVGGGMMTGLAQLLLGERQFGRIMEMAARGERSRVDLMVSDLYPSAADSPVLSSLTAANFGKKDFSEKTREDVASSIVQVVIETVAVLAIQVARTFGCSHIVMAGSPSSSVLVRQRLSEIGSTFGYEFAYLEHGAYCGALGAILLGINKMEPAKGIEPPTY